MPASAEAATAPRSPDAEARRPGGRSVDWTVALPVLAAALLGVWGLGRSMWADEAVTYDVSQRSLPHILALVHHVDLVHSAYYLLAHLWMLPGGGAVWLRVPSVLATAASAGLISALGARLVGRRAGLLAGLWWLTLPIVSFYAQEARSYALVTAAVLTATFALVRAVESGRTRWWAAYVAAVVAAQTLNELAVLVLAAHALTLALSRVPRATWRPAALAALVCSVLVAPLVVLSQRQSARVAWIPAPSGSTLTHWLHSLLGPPPVAAVTLILLLLGVTVPRSGPIGVTALALPLVLLPSLLLLAASIVQPLFLERYVLYCVPGVALLAGTGLDRAATLARRRLPRRGAGPAVCGVVLVAVLAGQYAALRAVRAADSRGQDLAAAARIVGQGGRPGDGVLFQPAWLRVTARAYPGSFSRLADVGQARSGEATGTMSGVPQGRAATLRAMADRQRLWVVGRPGLRLEPGDVRATAERRLLARRFHLSRSWTVHGLEVALYIR